MVDTQLHQNSVQDALDNNREKELRVFDDTKVGVKLFVDNGIVKIPRKFVIHSYSLNSLVRLYVQVQLTSRFQRLTSKASMKVVSDANKSLRKFSMLQRHGGSSRL